MVPERRGKSHRPARFNHDLERTEGNGNGTQRVVIRYDQARAAVPFQDRERDLTGGRRNDRVADGTRAAVVGLNGPGRERTGNVVKTFRLCLLYTSPSPRDED